MSADNRVCIFERKGNMCPGWYVWMGSASHDYHEPPQMADCYCTEKEALEAAHRMEEDATIVEYGTCQIDVEEQRKGLTWELADLAERLLRLQREGHQWANPNDNRDE